MGAAEEHTMNPKDGITAIRNDLTYFYKRGMMTCLEPLMDSYIDTVTEEELSAVMKIVESKIAKYVEDYTTLLNNFDVISKDISYYRAQIRETQPLMKRAYDHKPADRISAPSTPIRAHNIAQVAPGDNA